MKVSKDFSIHEFVPPAIYEHFVDKSIWFIDPKIMQMAQFIRDRFGKPIMINNYLTGGSYQYSAFRDSACTIGATNSQHRHGRAIDFRIQGMSPIEIRVDIIKNFEQYRVSGLTTIEGGTPTWTHIDCRFTNMDSLLIVPYK
ncbi:MAG: hypothetical protein D4R64_09285 [Porphyromonadaceae bacterium]|nr:MAG: hypothetical protein D4R64_09285 [Porphyromonadaceae bacterium]